MIEEKTKLSSKYTVGDLSATSKPVTQPNLPSTNEQLNNLKLLADALEMLERSIGPLSIISGFRTAELQNLLKSQGDPVASGKSYHEVGLGVDIYPKSMKIAEYFGRILANPSLMSRFIEVSIKPTQNTIHLAVKPLGDTRAAKVLSLTSSGYKAMSLEEIKKYAAPYVGTVSVGVVALALLGLAYYFMPRRA